MGTLAASAGLAVAFNHTELLKKVSDLGSLFPEGIMFTAGTGITSFFYYSFIHQNSLLMESKMNADKDFLVCVGT